MGLGYSEILEGQDRSPAAQTGMIAALLDELGIDMVDIVANDSGNTKDPALALLPPPGLGALCYTDPAFVTPELLEINTPPLVSPELPKAQFHAFWIALEPNPLLAIEPELRRRRVPLRVVWGTGDHFFPTASAEWLDRAFPNSRGVRWVEGAKLFFPEEMPDLIAEEARRLWDDT